MDKYRKIFIAESQDIITELENDLIELEKDLANEKYIHNVFRHLHTVKGGALMLELNHLGDFVHEVETVFDLIREGAKKLDDQVMALTFQALDHLKKLLNDPDLKDDFLRENQDQLLALLKGAQSYDAVFDNILPEGESHFIYYVLIKPQLPLPLDSEHPVIFIIKELEENYEHYHLLKCSDEEGIHFWLALVDFVKDQDELESLFLFLNEDISVSIEEISPSEQFELSAHTEESISARIHPSQAPPSQEEILALLTEIAGAKNKEVAKAISPEEEVEVPSDSSTNSGSTRISMHKVSRLMNAVSELVTLNSALKNVSARHNLNDLTLITEKIELEISHLRQDVFSMNLLPLSTLNTQFKRMVRDIARKMGKEVDFEMLSGDTELDRYMIDSLKSPLLHILRNSIDHGIESKEERLKKGKKETGLISMRGYYTGTNVIIEIRDDGQGIDTEKVRQKAIQQGIIQTKDELSETELLDLICHPGLSTAEKVTDLSGRGVGMNVVKKNIEHLRGNLEISSIPEEGTKFNIRLPLTLSIIDGLLVEVEHTKYIVPMFSIERIYRVPLKVLEREKNFSSLVNIDEQQVSVLNLRREFQADSSALSPETEMEVILITKEGPPQAIAVDRIEGEVQAIIKPIGKYFQDQKYILGSSVLGDGSLALVLDTHKLIHQGPSLN